MMQPVLEDVALRLENEAKIAKVDTDKSPKLGGRYGVEALPTLILFHEGKEIERFLGFREADELEVEIRRVSPCPCSQYNTYLLTEPLFYIYPHHYHPPLPIDPQATKECSALVEAGQ